MSAIRRPRANFRGVFTTNVPTANNDKTADSLDEANVKVENLFNKAPDEAYREWMMQTFPDPKTSEPWLNSYFNYFGDSGMSFRADPSAGMPYVNTIMVSSVLPGGKVYKPGQDIFLGGQVELWGDLFFDKPGSAKMVDLDPIGAFGTQIFSGEVRIVDPSSRKVMLSGKNPTRAFIRNMYIDRNITPIAPPKVTPGPWMGGAIWQLGLPLEGLKIDESFLSRSPTLKALATAARAGQGLLMRFAVYYTVDGIDEGKLADKFAASGYKNAITNPATGMLVGSIGAWEKGELASMPIGRLLYPSLAIPRPTSDYAFNVDMRGHSQQIKVDAGSPSQSPPPYQLGPAVVFLDKDEKIVILDLLTTIPESSTISQPPHSKNDFQKANYGNLTLTICSNGSEQTVATIPYEQYDRDTYELGSGIVEIPYSQVLAPALFDTEGLFCLYGQTLGPQPPQPRQPAMQEINYGYVFTDDQCLYLQQGESITYQIKVFYKGEPVRNRVIPITTSEYHFVITPGSTQPQNLPSRTFVPLDNTSGNEFIVSIPPQQVTASIESLPNSTATNPTVSYKTDGNGMITLKVAALSPGAGMVRYQLPGDTFDPGAANNYPYFGLTFYNAFRVLPNDNYDDIPDDQITWDFVYQEVIRYFYLLYPGMFARLAFQNEEVARKSASLIRQMVDKRTWESTSYMPVSRDLSDGKRKLLQRWCALNQ